MKYGSACSGIEAASVAWAPLGWEALWFSEIEPFPCAVLDHRWPGVPNLGDMTGLHEKAEFNYSTIDLLVAGTPCQSFSVAGLRGGLDDPRGNLTLHLLKLLDRKRPRWFVWENVPGVFSSWSDASDDLPLPGPDDPPRYGAVVQRNDFDTFIHGLEEIGYGVAWRLFDAQYFDLAQRRERVFVVGYLGDWRPAASVLFERESMRGDPPPSRETGKVTAPIAGSGAGTGRTGNERTEADMLIPTVSGAVSAKWAKGTGAPAGDEVYNLTVAPVVVKGAAIGRKPEAGPQWGYTLDDGSCFTLDTKEPHAVVAPLTGDAYSDNASEESKLIAFSVKDHGNDAMEDLSPTLRSGNHDKSHANGGVMPAVAYDIHTNDGGNVKRKDRPNGGFYVNETDLSLTIGSPRKSRTGQPDKRSRCVAATQRKSRDGRKQPAIGRGASWP